MNIKYVASILLILFISCSTKDNKREPNNQRDVKDIIQLNDENKKIVDAKIDLFEKECKYFPIDDYTEAVAYELKGKPDLGGITSILKQSTGKTVKLSSKELENFITIINDKTSFGVGSAACHEPRLGIFFKKGESIISYLTLCLACNNLYTTPELNLGLEGAREDGFNKEARRKIRKIIDKWGFKNESISMMFDHEETIRELLEKKGFTKKMIDQEIKSFEE